MKMSEICVKIAVSAVTAMAAGTASILASEGTRKGLAVLMNRNTTPDANVPIDTTAESVDTKIDTDLMTEAMDVPDVPAEEPNMEPGVEDEA